MSFVKDCCIYIQSRSHLCSLPRIDIALSSLVPPYRAWLVRTERVAILCWSFLNVGLAGLLKGPLLMSLRGRRYYRPSAFQIAAGCLFSLLGAKTSPSRAGRLEVILLLNRI